MAPITQARLREYFNYDPETGKLYYKERPRSDFIADRFYKHHLSCNVGREAGSYDVHGYIQVTADGMNLKAHRIIWLFVHGEWPKFPDFEIDHIDRNRANNRLNNLRVVTRQENCRNSSLRSNNTSGVTGVSWSARTKKWVATIRDDDRKIVCLGSFEGFKDAANARVNAEVKYWGAAYQEIPACM